MVQPQDRGWLVQGRGEVGMRKEEMVNRLNELLEMKHRLSVWQFLQVRKYELQEMVARIEELRSMK